MYPNDLVHDQLADEDEHGNVIENTDQQFFNVLVVTLRKLKEKRKTTGGSRKIAQLHQMGIVCCMAKKSSKQHSSIININIRILLNHNFPVLQQNQYQFQGTQ